MCPCTAKVFVTPGKPWADTIDCSYRREHTAKNLVGLKSYLAAGTLVSVVEEKVNVWQSWVKGGTPQYGVPSGRQTGVVVTLDKGPWVSQPLHHQLLSPGRCSHGRLMLIQKKRQLQRGRQEGGCRRLVPEEKVQKGAWRE